MRFRRRNDPLPRLVRDYERKFWLLWKENTDLRKLSVEMRDQLAADDQAKQTLQTQLAEKDKALQLAMAELTVLVNSRSWRLVQKLRQICLALIGCVRQSERQLDRLPGRSWKRE